MPVQHRLPHRELVEVGFEQAVDDGLHGVAWRRSRHGLETVRFAVCLSRRVGLAREPVGEPKISPRGAVGEAHGRVSRRNDQRARAAGTAQSDVRLPRALGAPFVCESRRIPGRSGAIEVRKFCTRDTHRE